MNRSAMSLSIQGRLPSSAYQCLHGPSAPWNCAKNRCRGSVHFSVVEHDRNHGHAQQHPLNVYRSSSPSRRVSIDVQHLLPNRRDWPQRRITTQQQCSVRKGRLHCLVGNHKSWHVFAAGSLSSTDSRHHHYWARPVHHHYHLAGLVKPFDAVAFYTASVVFAVLDLSVAIIRAFLVAGCSSDLASFGGCQMPGSRAIAPTSIR
ncbi:hypothetical protein BCR44DRAFT_1041267 [Catenaria anguillulae PL171]|uniref:Uncharacterized protein n=1 Tax=Catenaria anguillulae PL171 TaxID=765915 RepID=A0A1Y2HRK8_9FUNG|nr:hypothetical protein BCR44DRAFT_1041267 [Catenaria anguillulae PL171]